MPIIAIIADDLSGAAELAGIAFARGLSADVQREFSADTDAEVIAVDTDSRGLPADQAAKRVAATASAVMASRPAWIFKKTDSVLRGNVRAEVEAILKVTGLSGAVLIPANPSRRRTIEGGRYLIGGVPLDQTEFALDPEHPRHSAVIAELLGGEPRDISVPDIDSIHNLERLAGQLDSAATLPAGAADFFTALLELRSTPRAPTAAQAESIVKPPALLVCGSRVAWTRRASSCLVSHVPVCIFAPIFAVEPVSSTDIENWARRATGPLWSAGRMLLGCGAGDLSLSPERLLEQLAEATACILSRTTVATLLVEGGATAAALAKRLGWTRFRVIATSPAGVGILKPEAPAKALGETSLALQASSGIAPTLLIKPGSYDWPDEIWRQFAGMAR